MSGRTARWFGAILLAAWVALAAAQGLPPKPGPKDLCPVCGMLVSKYPNWVATIVYKDGHAHHFDGAKDMFKFWFDPAKFAAGHKREDMAALWVTDFYNLQAVDARKAWYVIGSDVLGPWATSSCRWRRRRMRRISSRITRDAVSSALIR